jgi:hypothetical protein
MVYADNLGLHEDRSHKAKPSFDHLLLVTLTTFGLVSVHQQAVSQAIPQEKHGHTQS